MERTVEHHAPAGPGGSPPGPPGGPADASPRPWYRRRWVVVLLAVGVVVTVGGIVLGILWSGRGAEEASVEDAVQRFRTSTTTPSGPDAVSLPVAGVYTYAGTGTEHLSFLDTNQTQGPEMPVTVTRLGGGCFRFRIDYNSHHWQDWHYCLRDGSLFEEGGRTSQRFDFVVAKPQTLNTFECDPPSRTVDLSAEPGDSWEQACTGTSSLDQTTVRSAGPTTFVGIEDVEVAGETVPAYHYVQRRDYTGDQSGTSTTDTWFAVADLLPLRSEHTSSIDSPSPLGTVTYAETGDWTASSLTPQT